MKGKNILLCGIIAGVIIVAFGVGFCIAQEESGGISINVQDRGGNPISGAEVTLKTASGSKRFGTVITNEYGIAKFSIYNPGKYAAEVFKSGYRVHKLLFQYPGGFYTTTINLEKID
ncbi:MAG: carboxypeptidase regulatory-like domain-containing protein [Phycisphaerae bacterium]|nr:carboxypeptidase regulatory-like domain-containing protein [Phycisphaerae bacterium]